MHPVPMSMHHIFVYGTLRAGFDGPMAHWLAQVAQLVGPAWVDGLLYRVADYPALVPGDGRVRGDLFVLEDADAVLTRLDAYEECTSDDPQPHEYRRVRLLVDGPDGPVEAWTYLYALPVAGPDRIAGGDFLAAGA